MLGGSFACFFVICCLFFIQVYTIRMSKSFDPDQARHSVGPDLDPNCRQ